MRPSMRFLFILAIFFSSPIFAAQVGIVQLSVGYRYCSGSVVKAENGNCHLLTAAHCAIDTPIYGVSSHGVGVWGRWIAGPDFGVVDSSLPIRRVDMDRDLAELVWPKSLGPLCSRLEPFQMRTAVDLAPLKDSVAVFGVIGQTVHAMTVDDGPRPQHAKPSVRTVYSLGGIDDLQIENVRGIGGLSGGPVVDVKGNLLGIYKRYIPRDDIVLVATTQQIQEFLNQLNPPRSLQLCPQTLGRYTYGGGNSHGNGGGDSVAGIDPEILTQWRTFLEPAEGILNPQNCANLIVGKGEASIDGPEDYEKLLRVPGPWIERPIDGLPAEKVRKEILDRFIGNYVSKGRAKTNGYSFKSGYVELAQGSRQTARVQLSIQKRSNDYLIRMRQSETETYSYQYAEMKGKHPDSSTELIARISPNADKVEMTQELNQYTCVNENYLKLACSGNGVLFSISKSSLSDSKLKLRYTRGLDARLRSGQKFTFFIHLIDELVRLP